MQDYNFFSVGLLSFIFKCTITWTMITSVTEPSIFSVLRRFWCFHVHSGQRHRYVPAARLQQRCSRTGPVQDEGRGRAPLLGLPGEGRSTGPDAGERSDVTGGVLRASQTADTHHSVRLHAGGEKLRRRHQRRWEQTNQLTLNNYRSLSPLMLLSSVKLRLSMLIYKHEHQVWLLQTAAQTDVWHPAGKYSKSL